MSQSPERVTVMPVHMNAILEAVQVFKSELGEIFQAYTGLLLKHDVVQRNYEELESRYSSLVQRHGKRSSETRECQYEKLLTEHGKLRQRYARVCTQLKFCTCNCKRLTREDGKSGERDFPGSGIVVVDRSETIRQRMMSLHGTELSRGAKDNSRLLGESVTFSDLRLAVQGLKSSVRRFSGEFLEKLSIASGKTTSPLLQRLQKDTYFSRNQHVGTYGLRSCIYHVLFAGFKGIGTADGFHTGNSTCRDHFDNFRQGQVHSDPHFWTFCREKTYFFSQEFRLPVYVSRTHKASESIGFLESIGGHCLASSFKEACKAIWLLHMLVSAYDPTLGTLAFNVSKNAELDANLMDVVVTEEDDSNLIKKVGFMICPGFRLQDQVIRSEVYLAGRSPDLK